MEKVIITIIICATLVVLAYIGQTGKRPRI